MSKYSEDKVTKIFVNGEECKYRVSSRETVSIFMSGERTTYIHVDVLLGGDRCNDVTPLLVKNYILNHLLPEGTSRTLPDSVGWWWYDSSPENSIVKPRPVKVMKAYNGKLWFHLYDDNYYVNKAPGKWRGVVEPYKE